MIIPGAFILFVLLVIGCNATDYCNKKLCDGRPHIGCKNSNKFSSKCDSPSIVNFGGKLQKLVLDTHNKYRNSVASGATKFSSAARMPLLRWNPELAKLAEYNVRQCTMKHDKCRSTDAYPYAGQNLGYSATTAPLTDDIIESYIKKVQDSWYSENSATRQSWLDKYTSNTQGNVIGHFTAMIQDRTTDIGCSAATYKMRSGSNKFNAVLMACNYSYTNMLNYPVYTKGTAASKCKTGADSTYTSLCSMAEVVVPKPF